VEHVRISGEQLRLVETDDGISIHEDRERLWVHVRRRHRTATEVQYAAEATKAVTEALKIRADT
jgi:hypothetical protein